MSDPTDSIQRNDLDDDDRDNWGSIRRMIHRVRSAQQESTIKVAAETRPPIEMEAVFPLSDTTDFFELEQHDQLPSNIGRFEIRRVLGRGGFGVVFLANDPQLDRPVALKVPKFDTLISSNGRSRFVREARAAALLGHPNIVSVYEAGQIGPVLYIAFEWIDGQPLSRWIEICHESLTQNQIAQLLANLAAGVQHAHQRGIIHRDLKPANILMQRDSSEDSDSASSTIMPRAMIADFGMAHLAAGDGLQTHSGAMMGTPAYMAPEQINSSAQNLSPAVDVYGLGTILYELLTGTPPFSGPSIGAIVKAVEHEMPVAPRRLKPTISPDLEAICLKCLEKQSDHRYATAADLQDDLERFLAGRSVRARRWSLTERAVRWVKQNRVIAGLVSAIILVLALGLGTAIWQANRNQKLFETSQKLFETSEAQKRRAEHHLDRAEAAIDQMLNQVAEALAPVPRMGRLRASLLEKALDFEGELAAVEGNDPDILLRAVKAQGRIGQIQMLQGRVDEAFQSLASALDLADVIIPENEEQEAAKQSAVRTTKLMFGNVLSRKAQFRELEELVAPLVEELMELDPSQMSSDEIRACAGALTLLGRAQMRQSRFAEAEAAYLKEIMVRGHLSREDETIADRQDFAMTWNALASTYRMSGDLNQATSAYQQSVDAMRELLIEEPDNPKLRLGLLISHSNLATCWIDVRNFAAAQECCVTALPDAAELLQQYPEVQQHHDIKLAILMSLATAVDRGGGNLEDAKMGYEQAIEFVGQMQGRFGTTQTQLEDLSKLHGQLGILLRMKMGQAEAVKPCFEKQIQFARQLNDEYPQWANRHWNLSLALGYLADYHLELGELDEAEPLFIEAESEAELALHQTPQSRICIDNLGWQRNKLSILFHLQGRYEESLNKAQQMASIDPASADAQFHAAHVIASLLALLRSEPENSTPQIIEDAEVQFLAAIERAIDLGWNDRNAAEQLGSDAGLIDDSRFIELLARF